VKEMAEATKEAVSTLIPKEEVKEKEVPKVEEKDADEIEKKETDTDEESYVSKIMEMTKSYQGDKSE
jgi:hypothetical protein